MDHVAIVTGAGTGIGRAVAARLAERGSKVIMLGRRRNELEAAAADVQGEVRIHPGDVRCPEDLQSAVHAGDALGGVNLLINNAGIMPIAPASSASLEDWRDTVDVNVTGALNAIHAVLPGMQQRGGGHIVNISSVAGQHPFPSASVYSASKSALDAISEGLRAEFAAGMKHGGPRIRVTSIAPGAVLTDLTSSIRDEETRVGTEAYYEAMDQPLTAADVADAVLFAVEAPNHVCISNLTIRPTAMTR
ncbi:MAG: SDR family oxidoreductase [Phycisphaerales bacterium]|jgi:NADP-dependent 3-hydroxy acid dehydrogenase YdfG|nr:SDR family oxidoreductase [Phycisphaerales bacterium]